MLQVIGKGKVAFVPTPNHTFYANTGKVRIGIACAPRPRRIEGQHEIRLQSLLLNGKAGR
ncbi:hypothetical protein FDI24_gp249 [Acidovorax phage ACP17]|uniref:Uncharacterized protein n=1 Tax=Acidovorax phage ACP17 TaxID=2010329 RepID=A0A218M3A2_9CAUD|nr:hypothetical protein FDI24_gp249 [Acidovorax phage ACP17]ASD50530.1 hypothetical protein [Acidovorax phage ACP17]